MSTTSERRARAVAPSGASRRAAHNQPWSSEEQLRLCELVAGGTDLHRIAALLQRSHQAVYTRALMLGCLETRARRQPKRLRRRRPSVSILLS